MRNHTLLLLMLGVLGCASKPVLRAPPPPVVPLPDNPLAGHSIPIWPVITMQADSSLGWEPDLTPRRQALDRADSVIAQALRSRRPMIGWVLPAEVRRAAQQSPGLLADPDRMATELLQTHALTSVAEPLRAQLRQLTGVATGGRFALVPAHLAFVRNGDGRGRANLVVALVDVRLGAVSWSATGSGIADNPWDALDRATRSLTAEHP